MLGLMQDWPLLCHRIIDHAAMNAGERPVISRSIEGQMHTTNYAEIRARALRVAQRLERDGLRFGDRVATLAWNTWRHLESWYGKPGLGGFMIWAWTPNASGPQDRGYTPEGKPAEQVLRSWLAKGTWKID